MGGAKKKSPAQQEKSQKEDAAEKKSGKKKGKKGEKSEGESKKAEISVIIDEPQTTKIIKNAKVITVQEVARQTGVKISTANAFLLKLMKSGEIKRIGGFSGHHIYQPVSA